MLLNDEKITPAYRPVVRSISRYRANLNFPPLPQDGTHSTVPFGRLPDSCAACQTFNPFFLRSKFRFQVLRRGWEGVFAGFGAGAALLRSASTHASMGKYRSP